MIMDWFDEGILIIISLLKHNNIYKCGRLMAMEIDHL